MTLIPCFGIFSASFLHWISLLSYPYLTTLYILNKHLIKQLFSDLANAVPTSNSLDPLGLDPGTCITKQGPVINVLPLFPFVTELLPAVSNMSSKVRQSNTKVKMSNLRITKPAFIHILFPFSCRSHCILKFYEIILQIFLLSSHLAFSRADPWKKKKIMRFWWESKCEINPNRKGLYSQKACKNKEH